MMEKTTKIFISHFTNHMKDFKILCFFLVFFLFFCFFACCIKVWCCLDIAMHVALLNTKYTWCTAFHPLKREGEINILEWQMSTTINMFISWKNGCLNHFLKYLKNKFNVYRERNKTSINDFLYTQVC